MPARPSPQANAAFKVFAFVGVLLLVLATILAIPAFVIAMLVAQKAAPASGWASHQPIVQTEPLRDERHPPDQG